MLTCEEVAPLLPAVAMGALDGEEQAAVQAHLPTCPLCLPQLLEYHAVALALAYAVPQQEPPPALGVRLLVAAADRMAPAAPVDARPPAVVAPGGNGRRGPAILRPAIVPAGPVDRLAGLYRRLAPVGFAVALLLVVVLGGLTMQMSNMASAQQQTIAMLRMPGAHVVALQPMTGTVASGNVYMAPDAASMGLMVTNLKPQPGRVYQFWLVMKDGQIRPCGTVPVDERGAVLTLIRLPMDLAQSNGVRITDEPTAAPTEPTGTTWLEAQY